jgi:hypothetical protein
MDAAGVRIDLQQNPIMSEHEKKRAPREPQHPPTDTEFLEEPHGKHGGSPESEGKPQDEPGSGQPSADSDHPRHPRR